MKKTIYLFLCLAFAAGVTSCAKTNKRKLSNDWKVTYDEETFVYQGGFDWTHAVVLEDPGITQTDITKFPGEDVITQNRTGTVLSNEFTIKKDGTWSRTKAYDLIYDGSTEHVTYSASGTWSFMGKSRSGDEDFGRRERVVFNLLKEKDHTEVYGSGGNYTGSDNDQTYVTGQRTMVYVVTSSKRKELHFELEGTNTFANGDGSEVTSTTLTRSKLTLKEK